MFKFRCTRPNCYGPNTPGYADPRERQGHYVTALDENEARKLMWDKFPGEKIDVERYLFY